MSDKNDAFDFTGLREVMDDSTSNKITAVAVSCLFLLLIINAVDLVGNNDGVREILDGNTDWQIVFDEVIVTQTDSVVIADGDTEIAHFPLMSQCSGTDTVSVLSESPYLILKRPAYRETPWIRSLQRFSKTK